MPLFVTRIELHDGGDYEPLHGEMERRGFSRTVRGTLGVYRLPTAEYLFEGAGTPHGVYLRVAEAMGAAGQAGHVFVSQVEGARMFFKLKLAE